MNGKCAVEGNSALVKKRSLMSAGKRCMGGGGGLCASYVQPSASVNAFSSFCCVDAVIPEFMACMDFFPYDR